MIPNPLTALEKDTEAQEFWQGVLENKHLPIILAAAAHIVQQDPPTMPGITEPMQVMALLGAAGIGARAQLTALGQCGTAGVHSRMNAEGRLKKKADVMSPARAGTGPGEMARAAESTPPPTHG